jgi:phosphoribosylglycinamide formyltransferase 2
MTGSEQTVRIGTPLKPGATRVLFCGSGELGKEVVIELQRYGVEVIAVDRYENAPAMQVAHRSHVVDMLDGTALRAVIEKERPHLIVPEIEAIATAELVRLEEEGYRVVPTARAVNLTMNREGIRRLAAEELELPTSVYRFAGSREEYLAAVDEIGLPLVVKPVMSSSGKGQSLVRDNADIEAAWEYAQTGGRAGKGRVIIGRFATVMAFRSAIPLGTGRKMVITGNPGSRTLWPPKPLSAPWKLPERLLTTWVVTVSMVWSCL